jgi:hypothetical protein
MNMVIFIMAGDDMAPQPYPQAILREMFRRRAAVSRWQESKKGTPYVHTEPSHY